MHPLLYEINTWSWLADLSREAGQRITLQSVPDAALDALATRGFDIVWLMGVWERSRYGLQIALNHPNLQADYTRVLPQWTPEDVAGSPYAVYTYQVAEYLGGRAGLAALRARLKQRGIKLMLDYVPNHTAGDHPWTLEQPDVYIQGTVAQLAAESETYFRTPNGTILAHGRDPYFPAWSDTTQVNAFSALARQVTAATLLDIATQCDGVRCDMAMLLVTRVFAGTWGAAAGTPPATEFWQTIIPQVKAQHPAFVFMAEVYWDMEAELQVQGFDFTYDKRLYDRLRHEDAASVRDHLLASLGYQSQMARFIENHDEERAVTAFGVQKSMAAMVLSATLPGLKFFHEGQFEGRELKIPVQLGTRPIEPINALLTAFYDSLLSELNHPVYHTGAFAKLGTLPILGIDPSHEQVIALAWLGEGTRLIAINLSDATASARIMLPLAALAGCPAVTFTNLLSSGQRVQIAGDEVLINGLPLTLAPYEASIFTIELHC